MSAESTLTAGEQFRRFWRWWTGELAACVPAGFRRWTTRLRVLPLVVPEDGRYVIYRYDGSAWKPTGKAKGDAGEALAKSLGAKLRRRNIQRFTLGLVPGQ